MRKLYRSLLYLTGMLTLAWLILVLFHFKDAAKIAFIGLFVSVTLMYSILIFGYEQIVSRFIGYKRSFRVQHRLYTTALLIGIYLVVLNVAFRYFHVGSVRMLSITGAIMIAVAMLLLVFLGQTKKKYILESVNAITLAASDLDRYTGLYFNEKLNMAITVRRNELKLNAQATGQSDFPLSAIRENVFNYLPSGIVMEFHPEKNEFILIQNGGYFPFLKQ